MRVLTLVDGYLPGFRYGGPVRTLAAMVQRMPEDIEFWIYTRNHDRGVSTPYESVETNSWNIHGRSRVYYGARNSESLSRLVKIARTMKADVLYANSLFARNTIRALVARRSGLLAIPLIIAPRGETAPSALALKAKRKGLYLRFAKRVNLFRDVVWQASNEGEAEDIARVVGTGGMVRVAGNIVIAPDLLNQDGLDGPKSRPLKSAGACRFVFISRIARIKNLDSAIRWLGMIKGRISLDVFGPKDDATYWAECERIARTDAPNLEMEYRGALLPDDVVGTFSGYHFFVFPTLGENFGHVIRESLLAGTPVLVSERTPWRLSQAGAGWTVDLSRGDQWVAALQCCVDMDEASHCVLRHGARSHALEVSGQVDALSRNVELFEYAASKGGGVRKPIHPSPGR